MISSLGLRRLRSIGAMGHLQASNLQPIPTQIMAMIKNLTTG
jgi:hypothetical protein